MGTNRVRTGVMLIAVNLGAFALWPAAIGGRVIHHHWIFPAFAAFLALQWMGTRMALLQTSTRWWDPIAARATVMGLLLVLLVMGVIRHQTVLGCVANCGWKLALACAIAAAVFGGQAHLHEQRFWNAKRAGAAAALSFFAGVWLVILLSFS